MRMQSCEIAGVRWINDAYNANPDSMRAALLALAARPCRGRRVAVLGDMLELGAETEHWHRIVGAEAARLQLDMLIAVGPQSRWMAEEAIVKGMSAAAVVVCDDAAQAVAALQARFHSGDCVLLKGSRGMKMELLLPAAGQQRTK